LRQLLMVKAGSAESAGLTAEELAEAKAAAETSSLEQILKALKGFTALSSGADMTTPLAMEMALFDATLKPAAAEKPAEAARARAPVEPQATTAPIKKVETPTKPVEPLKASTRPVEPPRAAAPAPVTTPQPPQSKVEAPAPRAVVVEPETTIPASASFGQAPVEAKPAPAAITNLEELVRQWPQLLTCAPPQLRRSSALAILRSAGIQPVGFTGGMVTLSFKFPIHMNKINEPENKKVTAEILSACLGVPVKVVCVLEQVSNHLVKEAQRRGAEIINVEDKWTSQK